MEKKITALKAECAGEFNIFMGKAKYYQKVKKDRQTRVLISKTSNPD